jgi:glucose-6-phosphate 1-dehydrogenase
MATAARPAPAIFVLFGATGDLARRMVLPAFYTLAERGLLPPDWRLIGNGRGSVAHEDFVEHVRRSLLEYGSEPKGQTWAEFRRRIRFAGGDFAHQGHGTLVGAIANARRDLGRTAQLIHYLAVPPQAFMELTTSLAEHDLTQDARVVYEKPFGTSQASFRQLDRAVHRVLDESQV